MMKFDFTKLALLCLALLTQIGPVFAQDGEAASSPAGLAMLILFLGIGGIVGVFVIRWSQTTNEEDE